MKTFAAISIVGVMAVAVFVTRGLSQKSEPVATMPTAICGTGCGQMMTGGEQMGPNMMDMMKQMGMEPEMMDRMQLLMRTAVFVDSPAALQAQKDKLQISQEQAGKLSEIEKDARQKALAVLTAEQRTRLGEIPEEPLVMMEMCGQMMKMCGGPGRSK